MSLGLTRHDILFNPAGSAGEWLTIRNKKGSVFGTEPFFVEIQMELSLLSRWLCSSKRN